MWCAIKCDENGTRQTRELRAHSLHVQQANKPTKPVKRCSTKTFDNGLTYTIPTAGAGPLDFSGTNLHRSTTETILLHDARTAPNREGAKAHALWRSGASQTVVYREPTVRCGREVRK